ncbi:proline iminopeptidase [Xylariomycetidae sp. FL0641]|nr:proline iminopeptidase [Xylariomycetidae sp. FL0641]
MASIMSSAQVSEGEIPFDAPGTSTPCKTWYKLIGSLDTPPLIALHGGPGAGHEYLSSMTDIHDKYQIPAIFYDQIGCGRSTHFGDKLGDASFWTFELFLEELENLVSHFGLHELGFYLLGQSWGGMLGGAYACTKPQGLKKLVLAGAPADIPLYAAGCGKLLSQLPKDVRETIEECEKKGDYESPEYEKASGVFYGQHFCRLDPMPEAVLAALGHLKEDPAAYVTMQGPSEFTVTGNYKDWQGWKEAHNINVPVLLISGRYDEVTESCVKPWFDTIAKIRWVTLENSAHMTHWEERERFMTLCGEFLSE